MDCPGGVTLSPTRSIAASIKKSSADISLAGGGDGKFRHRQVTAQRPSPLAVSRHPPEAYASVVDPPLPVDSGGIDVDQPAMSSNRTALRRRRTLNDRF